MRIAICVAPALLWMLLGAPPTATGQTEGGTGASGSGSAPEAGTAVEPVEPGEEPPGQIEALEIVGERIDVTDVQDEARAVTSFSAEDLDRANILSVDSLAVNVPGLHVGQAGQAAIITLRGIGTENASLTGEPGVAFHVDGINFARPSAARVAFFDLEGLEVNRGPQGLLGGKNSTSGSINLITRKPHDEYEVTGDVMFGNLDRVRMEGALNVPLGEFMATRLAFFHEDRDGYLDNELLSDSRDPFDVDDFGLRGHLNVRPSDTLDLLVSYDYFKQTGNGPQTDVIPVSIGDPGCGGLASGVRDIIMPVLGACFINQEVTPLQVIDNGDGTVTIIPPQINEFLDPAIPDADPRSTFANFASSQDNRYWGWGLTADWDAPELPLLGETRVRLLGGFRKTINGQANDFDSTSVPTLRFGVEDSSDQYSSEFQWSGMFAERLEWQTSLFYAHEKATRFVSSTAGEGGATGGGGVSVQTDSDLSADQKTDNKSYGAALHTTFHWTDTLRFTLGGRWIKDRKRNWLLDFGNGRAPDEVFRGCTGRLGFVNSPAGRVPGRDNPWCELLERHTMWGAGLDWRPDLGPFDGNHLFYTKIDRSTKSGGFRAGEVGTYRPESIWAYALGSKSEFFDSRVRLNIEGFFYAYEDLQLVFVNGTALRTENTDARMYGFDVEALAQPIPGLELSAVISHLKTETRDYFSVDPSCSSESTQIAIESCRSRFNERQRIDTLNAEGRADQNLADDGACFDPITGARVSCGALGARDGLDDFSENDLSRSPEWKVTLSAQYEIPLGPWGLLTPRVQYTWQDDTSFRAFNRAFDVQEDFHQTDVKLIWGSPDERWEVEAFVQNIEDEAPKNNILIGPNQFGSPALAWYGTPRFYGMRVQLRY